MRLRAGSFAFLVTLVSCAVAHAQAPTFINFQGKLSETDGTPVTGSVLMVFRIYDASTGGTEAWSSGAAASVDVNKGLFSVILNGIDPAVLSHTECWLEMEVDSEIMSPRQQLVSVAFAQVAAKAADSDKLGGSVASDFATAAALNDASAATTPVGWNDIASVPAGFADGVDNGLVEAIFDSPGVLIDSGDPAYPIIMVDRAQFDGWYVGTDAPNSVSSGMIVDGTITNADLAAGAFPSITGVGTL
ncbi:MAG: hypothetical protein ACYS9X_12780, partial [Planctomycetota bacterium]